MNFRRASTDSKDWLSSCVISYSEMIVISSTHLETVQYYTNP
ncbi:Bgt-51720 [Blumeria graminis f. sp. tritici]|uniref:Bgt-51720 n=1 Tax=Blumeria graminis f. sp. tritici TaxID=62690 RepID=A0A9X9PS37_BLUGR|nr:Bgt-51720 [Blumeria graminis f. sp. tritici]